MGFNIKGFVKDVLKMSLSMSGVGTGIGKGTVSDRLEPTDVEITGIDLVTGPGGAVVQSLASVVKEINIYESILSPAVFCNLIVYDANDLIEKAKVDAYRNSYVKVGFKSPNVSKPNEYTFLIEDVIANEQKNSNLGQVYVLRCIPPEVKVSQQTILQPGDNQWDGTVKGLPSEIIPIIVEFMLGSNKKVHVKKKAEVSIDEIFAPTKPMILIDELRKYCVVHDPISSCFVFYEDCDGYHLNTIENMIKEQKTIFGNNDSDKIFYFDAKRNQNNEGSNYRSVLGFKALSIKSVLDDYSGSYLGLLKPNNPDKWQDPDTAPLTYVENIVRGDMARYHIMDQEGEPLASVESEKSKKAATKLLIVQDGDKPDLLSGRVIDERLDFLSNLLTNMKHIYVYGDNSIRIGNLITVNFVRPSDITGNEGKTIRSSGQYMVGKIRHMIINDDRPKYLMSMEIFKSGVQGD